MPTMRNQRRCSQCQRVAMYGSLLCWQCTPPDERPEPGANKRKANRERMAQKREDMRMLGIPVYARKRPDVVVSGTSGTSVLSCPPGVAGQSPAGAAGATRLSAGAGGAGANALGVRGYDVRAVLWRLARDPKATATARASAARTLAEMDGIIGKHQQAPERISDATLATLSRSDLVQELARLRDRCAKDGARDVAETIAGQG